MPSHDIEHCTGEGCGVRETCHRNRQWEALPDSLQGRVPVRSPLYGQIGPCDIYWPAPPPEAICRAYIAAREFLNQKGKV